METSKLAKSIIKVVLLVSIAIVLLGIGLTIAVVVIGSHFLGKIW